MLFTFAGKSLPLTVMHTNPMHHVMSTHLVTVCPDPAVNIGNQVVGGVHR